VTPTGRRTRRRAARSLRRGQLGIASLAGPVEDVGPSIKTTSIESKIRLEGGEVAVIATAASR
jgi:hypothetical protein